MRIAFALVVLLVASPVEAAPSWWQQFYAYVGYRDVDGLDRASGRTFALGYRIERPRWGVDIAVLDHTAGREEGMHQLVRVTGYGSWRRFWAGAGGSYALLDGWTHTTIPHRQGHGFTLDAVVGVELASAGFLRTFIQLDLSIPTFAARDRYESVDTMVRPICAELALGLRF